MTTTSVGVPFAAAPLDRTARVPLHQQLYEQLRSAILSGRLLPGTRLPATRIMAAQLGVSRNTVQYAFQRLLGEDYIEGKVGSGTHVSSALSQDILDACALQAGARNDKHPTLSLRGAETASFPRPPAHVRGTLRAFRPTEPAIDLFPFDLWARIAGRRWRRLPGDAMGYGQPAGDPRLRAAIAGYLQSSRAVKCSAEQVIVTAGSQQALYLVARLLLDEGDRVLFENPSFWDASAAFRNAGAELIPLPVDHQGADIARATEEAGPDARMAYVTPSHQFPLGYTMSLTRRLTLLGWARQADAWIFEDDYDSEFRYVGSTLPALQGLDESGRVLYTGTFSKLLFPGLRLGYLVVPEDLVDVFSRARELMDHQPPILDQLVLADFMEEGHFARHLRRMRSVYEKRRSLLVAALTEVLGDVLNLEPSDAGLRLLAWLPEGWDDQEVSQLLADAGVESLAVGTCCWSEPTRPGLLLGFAAADAPAIREGVRIMASVLKGR